MLVSILGDSISTYQNYNPSEYAVFYDSFEAERNGLRSVYDTWWAQVNQFLKAYLCVNNSYSGSRVSGWCFPSACHEQRTSALHRGQDSPDIILIYMGINDFGYGVPVYGTDLGHFEYAYETMLTRIKQNYPRAWVFCGTLMQGYVSGILHGRFPFPHEEKRIHAYNNVIRSVSRNQQCVLADLASLGQRYETLDGVHPTAKGHQTIAQCWISRMKRR